MGKVLLTGGAGYIGCHTCVELLNSGYEILVADNYVNSSPRSLDRVREITGRDFPNVEIDLCDAQSVEKLFCDYDIDAVIHFAGLKAVGESVMKPVLYYRNNLDTTLALLEAMQRHNVKKFIFSSSATVYGDDAATPCGEEVRLTFTCSNPYGRTKFMIEQILKDTAATDADMGVVLLRYFNPVGAHESGMIGEDPNGIPNNLMPRLLQAAQGKFTLGVFGDDYPTPDGTCQRDYIHVVDLARGHVAALKYLEEHTGVEVVNLGTGRPYSVLEMIRAFRTATGIDLPYTIQPRRAGDLAVYYADPAKAKRLFGWETTRTLEDMCRDAWKWQTMNPNGFKD